MNVLMIVPGIPFPPKRGYEVGAYNVIMQLSKNHHISLLCLHTNKAPSLAGDSVIPANVTVYTHCISKVDVIYALIKGVISNVPLQSLLFSHDSVKRKILKIIKSSNVDVCHFYTIRTAPLALQLPVPCIIDLVDSMVLNFERRLAGSGIIRRIIYHFELRKLRFFEPFISFMFTTACVSTIDAQVIGNNSAVIPLGVDTNIFYPIGTPVINKIVGFSGNLFYSPNEEAVLWFINNCWQGVRAKHPTAIFRIIGPRPSKRISRHSSLNGIEVIGHVKCMGEALRNVSVSVAPMLSGSGMQNKILEAMACGIPVVATSLGRGTIKAVHDESIVIADSSDEFINSICDLLDTPKRRSDIGIQGLQLVRRGYTWNQHAQEVLRLYHLASARVPSHQLTQRK